MRSLMLLLAVAALAGCNPAPSGQHDYKPLIAVAEGQALSAPISPSVATPPCADCASTAEAPASQESPTAASDNEPTSAVVFNPSLPAQPPVRVRPAPVATGAYYTQPMHLERRGLWGRRVVWVNGPAPKNGPHR